MADGKEMASLMRGFRSFNRQRGSLKDPRVGGGATRGCFEGVLICSVKRRSGNPDQDMWQRGWGAGAGQTGIQSQERHTIPNRGWSYVLSAEIDEWKQGYRFLAAEQWERLSIEFFK